MSASPPELNSSTTIEPGTSSTGRIWLRKDVAAASSIAPDNRTVGRANRAASTGGISAVMSVIASSVSCRDVNTRHARNLHAEQSRPRGLTSPPIRPPLFEIRDALAIA
jgi:hypothetical protein